MTQAFHTPRDERIDVPLAVVAVCREMAQKLGIGLAGPKQVAGDRIHLLEAVIAENDLQILVGVNQRTGHVVQH